MTPEELAKSGSEHSHQRALFAQIAAYCYEHRSKDNGHYQVQAGKKMKMLFAINNAVGRNNARHGARNKAEGVKAGVWDLFLPVPRFINVSTFGGWHVGSYHGLFIEMKKPEHRSHQRGGLSEEQLEFGLQMRNEGYATKVCYTWEEAFNTLLIYLGAKT